MVICEDCAQINASGGRRVRRRLHKRCCWLTGRNRARMTREAPDNHICRTVVIPRPHRNNLLLRLLLNETVPPSGSTRTPQLRHLLGQRVVLLPNFRSFRRVTRLEGLGILIRVDGVRLITDLQHGLCGGDISGRRGTARLTGTTWAVSVNLPLAGGTVDDRVWNRYRVPASRSHTGNVVVRVWLLFRRRIKLLTGLVGAIRGTNKVSGTGCRP